jgi:hypothetical protein
MLYDDALALQAINEPKCKSPTCVDIYLGARQWRTLAVMVYRESELHAVIVYRMGLVYFRVGI